MLDINIDVELKKVSYPILFDYNRCVKCGAEGTLKFVDIFGRKVNQEIYPLEKIKCFNCGAKYGIQWNMQKDGKLNPKAVDDDIGLMFKNIINHTLFKSSCNKITY